MFPKGGIEGFEQSCDAAVRETWEEAGVRGTIVAKLEDVVVGKSAFDFFLFQVEEECGDWPERHERDRKWVSFSDLRPGELRNELQVLISRVEKGLSSLS